MVRSHRKPFALWFILGGRSVVTESASEASTYLGAGTDSHEVCRGTNNPSSRTRLLNDAILVADDGDAKKSSELLQRHVGAVMATSGRKSNSSDSQLSDTTEEESTEQLVANDTTGSSACPCLAVDYPKDTFNSAGKVVGHFDLPGGTGTSKVAAAYPADLGSYCQAWDAGIHPQCQGMINPSWCSRPWCYVDLCNCNLDVIPKHHRYIEGAQSDGKTPYYSYRTCGAIDSYSSGENNLACPTMPSRFQCSDHEHCTWTGSSGCVHNDIVSKCATA